MPGPIDPAHVAEELRVLRHDFGNQKIVMEDLLLWRREHMIDYGRVAQQQALMQTALWGNPSDREDNGVIGAFSKALADTERTLQAFQWRVMAALGGVIVILIGSMVTLLATRPR